MQIPANLRRGDSSQKIFDRLPRMFRFITHENLQNRKENDIILTVPSTVRNENSVQHFTALKEASRKGVPMALILLQQCT